MRGFHDAAFRRAVSAALRTAGALLGFVATRGAIEQKLTIQRTAPNQFVVLILRRLVNDCNLNLAA
jgi:hypothetical protein